MASATQPSVFDFLAEQDGYRWLKKAETARKPPQNPWEVAGSVQYSADVIKPPSTAVRGARSYVCPTTSQTSTLTRVAGASGMLRS
jgi:hypothetical protein